MTLADDPLTPAAGRTVILLGSGWTAVVLEPLPGHPYRAVGFFRAGQLEHLVDEPAEVRAYLASLVRIGAG